MREGRQDREKDKLMVYKIGGVRQDRERRRLVRGLLHLVSCSYVILVAANVYPISNLHTLLLQGQKNIASLVVKPCMTRQNPYVSKQKQHTKLKNACVHVCVVVRVWGVIRLCVFLTQDINKNSYFPKHMCMKVGRTIIHDGQQVTTLHGKKEQR